MIPKNSKEKLAALKNEMVGVGFTRKPETEIKTEKFDAFKVEPIPAKTRNQNQPVLAG
jgi:hypothetical protein